MVAIVNYYYGETFYYILSVYVSGLLTLVVMLTLCLCCKRNLPKNDMMGLEGMVKLKNPDEILIINSVGSDYNGDLNLSTISQVDSEKRISTALHRSLPDIPVMEVNGDTGSEFYETVADKALLEAQNQLKGRTHSLKKEASVSQHSSLSQADDVSSPYSRVKNSQHDYAKVRPTEHPYAQLNAPSTLQINNSHDVLPSVIQQTVDNNENRCSPNSEHSRISNDNQDQVEIPAASAIAGMISASIDLPYMTPPITGQHFSGDSQDSSKGYTSISVREPLANILAQKTSKQLTCGHSGNINDSHYATVSDDSDETYAAIEDSNMHLNPGIAADIYTSGSETYAQIQPKQFNSVIVCAEINQQQANNITLASSSSNICTVSDRNGSVANQSSNHLLDHTAKLVQQHSRHSTLLALRNSAEYSQTAIQSVVDNLKAQVHSRQASLSSNNSSLACNLGSPKPEKRQANSPLPPTPKINLSAEIDSISTSNLTSGHNSVISVVECVGTGSTPMSEFNEAVVHSDSKLDISPIRKNKNLSPSKDVESMYAKVIKKSKFSQNLPSSQNSSPIMIRKLDGTSVSDVLNIEMLGNVVSFNDLPSEEMCSRVRSNSHSISNEHGYETIPADGLHINTVSLQLRNQLSVENHQSDCYTYIMQKGEQCNIVLSATNKKLFPTAIYNLHNNCDKHYETIDMPTSSNNALQNSVKILKTTEEEKHKTSQYNPNFEMLRVPILSQNSTDVSNDGYAKVLERKSFEIDAVGGIDGYSKIKAYDKVDDNGSDDAQGDTLGVYKRYAQETDGNHNYASILETKQDMKDFDTDSDHYARIIEEFKPRNSTQLNILPLSTTAKLVTDDVLTPRTTDLYITSSNSITSNLFVNASASSMNSSNNLTTSTANSLQQVSNSTSQYESLTGSETDPNYESVCYLNSSTVENPYELLHTESTSDIQMSNSSHSADVYIITSSAENSSPFVENYKYKNQSDTDSTLCKDRNTKIITNEHFHK